jgi:hypothetical protein
MAEARIKAIIDEYARDKKMKISTIGKAIDDELDRILREVIGVAGES